MSTVPQKELRANDTSSFIKKSKIIHKDRYIYEKSVFKGARTKLTVTCKIHGDFEQTPQNHFSYKNGCKKCIANAMKSNTSEFIIKAKAIHGDRYDYSSVNYTNNKTKVIIICKRHGIFKITPSKHLEGVNCKKCSIKAMSSNTCEFIARSKLINGNRYDYSFTSYKKSHIKVKIICKIHGVFEQTPGSHLSSKSGCPRCASSKLEKVALKILVAMNIKHEREISFSELGKLRYDFCLPNFKILIEMDGRQHFEAFDFSSWGGEEGLKNRQESDRLKNEYAKNNGYTLIRIPYNAKPSPRDMLISELLKHGVKPQKQKVLEDATSPLRQSAVYQPSLFNL